MAEQARGWRVRELAQLAKPGSHFRQTSNSLPNENEQQQQQQATDWVAASASGSSKLQVNNTGTNGPTNNNSSSSPVLLVRSLLAAFLSVFSRRSRRKEFDKASSIQQHLRAIRHAENLDRQTHFRRSQGKSSNRESSQ